MRLPLTSIFEAGLASWLLLGRAKGDGAAVGVGHEGSGRAIAENELWGGTAAAADVARGGDGKRGIARTAGGERASSQAPSAVMGGGSRSGSKISPWCRDHHGQNAFHTKVTSLRLLFY